MIKQQKDFQLNIMIDNKYDIVGCMDKEYQQIVGMKCYDVFDFIGKDECMRLINQTIQYQSAQKVLLQLTKDWDISIKMTPIFNPSCTMVTCHVSVNEKREEGIDSLYFNDKLGRSKYDDIIEMVRLMPVAASVLDPNNNYKYVEWNKTAEDILGRKRSDIIGKTRFEIFSLNHAKIYHKSDVDAIKNRRLVIDQSEYEFTFCCQAKSKYLKTYRMPIYDEQNKPVMLLLLVVDITESIIKEKELVLTEKFSLIGQLASGIAHNIGNQLSIMSGALSVIKQRDKEQVYAQYTSYIKTAINHSSELIHQLLDFGRETNFNQEEINIHDILIPTVEMVRYLFKKNIKIETELDANWPYVKGNASRIQNTVLNMLINARDAMPNGGIIRVITNNDEEKDMICIHIEDNGEGMDQSVADKVFDPFFTTKKLGKGTGMGLASAYGNIKQMNGSINVNSCKGMGSVFTIRLPITKEIKAS